jgi:hypothetical protein
MAETPVRLKYSTAQAFSPGGGISVSYTHLAVSVKNLGFAKDVVMHRRHYDGTWLDEPLAWHAHHGDHDLFQISGPHANEFAVRYSVDGATYWDNNGGTNYHVPTADAVCGGNVALKKATARRGVQAGGGFTVTTSWIEGEIYVNNLSFVKEIAIRYSRDNGLTWSDTFADHVGKANDHAYTPVQQVEVWKFKTPEFNLAPADFRFAVYYRVPAWGVTFWDNNHAHDFRLTTQDGAAVG